MHGMAKKPSYATVLLRCVAKQSTWLTGAFSQWHEVTVWRWFLKTFYCLLTLQEEYTNNFQNFQKHKKQINNLFIPKQIMKQDPVVTFKCNYCFMIKPLPNPLIWSNSVAFECTVNECAVNRKSLQTYFQIYKSIWFTNKFVSMC